jgi:hypothetical protein
VCAFSWLRSSLSDRMLPSPTPAEVRRFGCPDCDSGRVAGNGRRLLAEAHPSSLTSVIASDHPCASLTFPAGEARRRVSPRSPAAAWTCWSARTDRRSKAGGGATLRSLSNASEGVQAT